MVSSLIGPSNDLGLHTMAGGLDNEEEAVAQKTLRYRPRRSHRHFATVRSENGE